MATNPIGITQGAADWTFQNTHIERHMDSAAYEAAHPDDTLVLAGPPRKPVEGTPTNASGIERLLAIGMLQSVQFTQTKPTQPMMAIGSGRSFFVSGKAQTQWNIARLFVNGRNLLRVLYHNALAANVDVTIMDDQPSLTKNGQFFINLDSELYYVPFGLAAFFRNKSHGAVGGFYCELAMINSYAVGMTAGQNMVLENVSGMADRLLPYTLSEVATVGAGRVTASGGDGQYNKTLDAMLAFSSEQSRGAGSSELQDPTG